MSRTKFDAPRPAVTNRLGKKQTDKLIRADGDTWQEYLAVSEKPNHATTSNSLSFFGKKNKKKSTKSKSNSQNNGDGNSLIVRSYFQNSRTGKKVWDEPPSGASRIVPATQDMRRMAELQLEEVYVATVSTELVDTSGSTSSSNKSKSKKALGGGLFRRLNSAATNSESSGSNRGSTSRRIRYKPDSQLYPPRAAPGSHQNEDRQLREAIERSIAETTGPTTNYAELTEDEILRHVLEESRLEALASSNSRKTDQHRNDNDRKPAARKHPPRNSGRNRQEQYPQQEISSVPRRRQTNGGASYPSRQPWGDRV